MTNDAFNALEKQLPMTWERVIDAAAAGSTFVGAAASDFKLTVRSNSWGQPFSFLIECKASKLHKSFTTGFRSLIKPAQLPLMRKEVRAGAIGLYFFHSLLTGDIEIWDMHQLVHAYYQKRKKFTDVPTYVIKRANYELFARRIVERPREFIRSILSYEGDAT